MKVEYNEGDGALVSGKKYLAEGAKSRKSSIIQKILPTEFSLDEDEEFSDITPANSNTGRD